MVAASGAHLPALEGPAWRVNRGCRAKQTLKGVLPARILARQFAHRAVFERAAAELYFCQDYGLGPVPAGGLGHGPPNARVRLPCGPTSGSRANQRFGGERTV